MPHAEAHPEQALSSETQVAELVAELADLVATGRTAEADALLGRYPQHVARLQHLLPAMNLLAHAGQVSERSSHAGGVEPGAVRSDSLGTLGDFQILREIGRGGMGVVYEAEQISLSRRVALKVLPFAGMLDARQLQRFKNEARAAAGLHHPNIVPVYSVGTDRGVHYYAMQYIEGQTLAEVQLALNDASPEPIVGANDAADQESRARSFATSVGAKLATTKPDDHLAGFQRTVVEWAIQIADALDYAHSLGITHRDIKPANLILDLAGRVWITDFGLAQVDTEQSLTMTGGIVGTPRYMSPEQARGPKELVDHRTDIYSLGVTLYELLARRPFLDATDARQILAQIADVEPLCLHRICPAVARDLSTIVHKTLEKDSANRYLTAKELADDLRRLRADQQIHARPTTFVDRCVKWSRRHLRVVLAALTVSVLLSVTFTVATWLVWREQRRGRELYLAEQSQHRRADGNVRIALRAMLWMYGHSAAQWNDSDPRKLQWQHDALVAMLSDLGRITDENGPSDLVVREQARVRSELGDVLRDLNVPDKSEQVQRQAIRQFEELLTRYPDEPELLHLLGSAQNSLGILLYCTERPAEGVEAARQSLKSKERLVELHAENVAYHTSLINSHINLGKMLRGQNRDEEAVAVCRRAVALAEPIAGKRPDDVDLQRKYVVTLENLAETLWACGQPDAVEELCRRQIAITAALAKREPLNQALRLAQASAQGQHAVVLKAAGRAADARLAYERSIELAQQLVDEFPEYVDGLRLLGTTLNDLALVVLELGEVARARQLLDRALPINRKTIDLRPQHQDFRATLTQTLFLLASVQLRQNDVTNLAETIDEFLATSARTAKDLCVAAEFLETAALQRGRGATGQDEPVSDVAREWLNQAGRLLVEAAGSTLSDAATQNLVASGLADAAVKRPETIDRAVELAQQATRQAPERAEYWSTLASAHFASGHWKDVVVAIQEVQSRRSELTPAEGLRLAAAHWQLGDQKQARQNLAAVAQALEQLPDASAKLRLLFQEVSRMLQSAAPSAGTR